MIAVLANNEMDFNNFTKNIDSTAKPLFVHIKNTDSVRGVRFVGMLHTERAWENRDCSNLTFLVKERIIKLQVPL